LILIGLYLGWQQVVSVCFLAALCLACFVFVVRKCSSETLQLPASAFLAAILVLQLLMGKYLTILPDNLEYSYYLILMGGQIIAIPLLVGVAQYTVRNREIQRNTQDQIPFDETTTITS
jgi:leader peptidase (prepilin peptidase) / N-methyltransferase